VAESAEHTGDRADAPPLTRRERRRREREAEAAAGAAAPELVASDAAASAPAEPVSRTAVCRMPPLAAVAAAAPGPRHPRRRRFTRGAAMLAMGFVAAMAVATSVPAVALFDPDAPAALADAAPPPGHVATDPTLPQTVTSSDTVLGQAIRHDDYTVKSWEQLVDLSHIRIADTFTNDPASPIQWPFPVGVPIASYFGARSAPTAGASTFHEGVDFDPGYGVDIHAIADGVVSEVVPYDNGGLGVHVIVDHVIDGQKVSSVYGHMKPGSIRVHVGQKVKVTDVVGQVGSTGISTGPHLHFEIRLGGTQAVDPYAWLTSHVV